MIGTGGFMLQEWEPGVRALTQRNPNYWKADHAHFDEIETIYIHDANAVRCMRSHLDLTKYAIINLDIE